MVFGLFSLCWSVLWDVLQPGRAGPWDLVSYVMGNMPPNTPGYNELKFLQRSQGIIHTY